MKIEKKFVFSKEDCEAVEAVINLLDELTEDGGIHCIVPSDPHADNSIINLDELWGQLIDLQACISVQGARWDFREELYEDMN